jgi:hypothetical protein
VNDDVLNECVDDDGVLNKDDDVLKMCDGALCAGAQ